MKRTGLLFLWLGFPVLIATNNFSSSQIPQIVHMVFGLKPEPIFSMYRYLNVVSAAHFLKPDVFYMWYHTEPSQDTPEYQWWELSKTFVTMKQVRNVTSIFSRRVLHPAHKADVIRLEKLIEYGGIYIDSDVLILQSFDSLFERDDSLRNAKFIIGQEHEQGLGNSVMLAAPGSLFLQRWYETYKSFSIRQWSKHSVTIPYQLSLEIGDQINSNTINNNDEYLKEKENEIRIVPASLWFYPLWNQLSLLYGNNSFANFCNNLGVHLWAHKTWRRLSALQPEDIHTLNSTYGHMLRYSLSRTPLSPNLGLDPYRKYPCKPQ